MNRMYIYQQNASQLSKVEKTMKSVSLFIQYSKTAKREATASVHTYIYSKVKEMHRNKQKVQYRQLCFIVLQFIALHK